MAKHRNSAKIANAFHEVFNDKPKTVDTGKSAEGQRKQMVAIALSKARAAGAHIPKGGTTPLSPDSMKGSAILNDRKSNLDSKKSFKTRVSGRSVRL
jgi:hypothetical protein